MVVNIGELLMAKTNSSQKKVSHSDLNNHNITNKRQALKDLKLLNFDDLQFKKSSTAEIL